MRKKRREAALAGATSEKIEKAGAGSGGSFLPQDNGFLGNCQGSPPSKPAFSYVTNLLATQQPAPAPADAGAAWARIVGQIELTRPIVASDHHLREASCRLEHGRLIVVPPVAESAGWLAEHLAGGRTRPLAVATALAGLAGLQVDFE